MANINYTKPDKLEDFSVWCSKKYPLWCKSNFPFIEDTFEALDTYGLICKIVQYLNETKQNLNTTEDNVQNIYDFVTNYFDNLDVQNEINNKLDEMASSGELQTLLTEQYNSLKSEVNSKIDLQDSKILNIESKVNSAASGSPAGVYDTLEELIQDDPSHDKIYVVKEDGEWYYWDSSINQWNNGGVYQSTGISNFSITNNLIKNKNITLNKLIPEIDILSKAISIEKGKTITGYSTSTFQPVLANNEKCSVIKMKLSDMKNCRIYNPLTEDAVQSFLLLDSNNEAHYNRSNNYDNGNYDYYNKETRILTFSMLDGSAYENYEYVLLTLYNDFLFIYSPDNKYEELIEYFSKNVKINNTQIKNQLTSNQLLVGYTDLLKYASNIYNNSFLTGYNSSTYKVAINTGSDVKQKVIEINLENVPLELFKNILYKIPINELRNPNIIIGTNEIDYAFNIDTSRITEETTKNGYFFRDIFNAVSKCTKLYIAIEDENFVEGNFILSTIITEDNPNYPYLVDRQYPNKPEFILNKKFKVLQNKYLNLYHQNFIKNINTKKANLLYANNSKLINDEVISYLGNQNKNSQIRIFEKDFNFIYDKNIEIEVIPSNAGANQTKKILFIGDSLTRASYYTEKLINLFSNDLMNIELIGTIGTGNNKYQAYNGWRAYTYCRCAEGIDDKYSSGESIGLSGTNPFYNTSTNKFDFSKYMSDNNFNGVDYVFINLGTNDIGRGNYDSESEIIGYYTEMINSIKQYNSNIKICLWLPPARALKNNYYGIVQTFSSLRMNKYLIDNFEDKENENIFLIPINVNINSYEDYPTQEIQISDSKTLEYPTDSVHPNINGYTHIAEVIYYWIKYLSLI